MPLASMTSVRLLGLTLDGRQCDAELCACLMMVNAMEAQYTASVIYPGYAV